MSEAAVVHRMMRDINRTGFYPDLVGDAIQTAVARQVIRAYLVQHEAAFDNEELRRHMTVLVLTDTRLIVSHTDEHTVEGTDAFATTTTEAVHLERIRSVVLSRVVPDPAHHRPGGPVSEVVINVGWGSMNRMDLEPATCGDPQCEADHGYTGMWASDDLSLRLSEAADGASVVQQALAFAAELSEATSGAGL